MLKNLSYFGLPLYISTELLSNCKEDPSRLRELFTKYPFACAFESRKHFFADESYEEWPGDKDISYWKEMYDTFLKRAEKGKEGYGIFADRVIELDMLAPILMNAKSILKSFLSSEKDNELHALEQNIEKYFKKPNNIHRLFTYNHLRSVIEEKGLSHVRLPKKFLFVYDCLNSKYLSSVQAASIIDNMVKIVYDDMFGMLNLVCKAIENYNLVVFAERIIKTHTPFNRNAQKELRELFLASPFDVGFDNIFSDSHGDAIIIDTEGKGTSESECSKLNRYFYH